MGALAVKWGIGLYTGQHPPSSPGSVGDSYAQIIDHAVHAERVGVDSIWLSEHHGADDGYLPSLLPVAAAILARTERLIVGTAVLLAPFQHPVRLAEDVAVIDQLYNGRFILGLGAGWRSSEFRTFGVPITRRAAALEDTVAILRRAWTGERFSYEGRYHRLTDVKVQPRPATAGGPPIWLGGTGPRALARAGRVGDGYVGGPFPGAIEAFEHAVDHVPVDRAAPFSFGHLRAGFIAGDADEAWHLAGAGMRYTRLGHARWAAEEAGRDAASVVVDDDDVRAYNFLGDPIDVTHHLSPLVRHLPGRDDCHVIVRLAHPFTPPSATDAAIDAYGRTVVPELRALDGHLIAACPDPRTGGADAAATRSAAT